MTPRSPRRMTTGPVPHRFVNGDHMNFRLARSVFIAPAVVALVAVGAPAAQAATPGDFNAPMFSTTATLTETRMPTTAQVNCSDARCTTGVLNNASGGDLLYSTPSIAPGGAFVTAPGFVAKLNKNWSNAIGTSDTNFSQFTINLAQFAPGSDLAATVAQNASSIGATLSNPETVGASTIWTTSATFEDVLWNLVYVSNGDALARGACLQYGADKGSVTCGAANLRALTLGVIDTPAATSLAEANSVKGLIPGTPKQLRPLVLNIEPAQALWAGNVPTAALKRAMAVRKNSVAMQYAVKAMPQLQFESKVAALSNGQPARSWVATQCLSATKTTATCTESRVSGPAYGYIGLWRSASDSQKVVMLGMHFTGNKKVGDATCRLTGVQSRGLTPAEVASCRAALTSFATNVVK